MYFSLVLFFCAEPYISFFHKYLFITYLVNIDFFCFVCLFLLFVFIHFIVYLFIFSFHLKGSIIVYHILQQPLLFMFILLLFSAVYLFILSVYLFNLSVIFRGNITDCHFSQASSLVSSIRVHLTTPTHPLTCLHTWYTNLTLVSTT